MQYIFAV